MFTDWFGSETNSLRSASFEGSSAGWGWGGNPSRLVINSPSEAKSGTHFLSMYAFQSGQSIMQDMPVSPQPRDNYTASIWLKSGTHGIPFKGALAIWALGGNQELGVVPFTVGNDWTEVTVTLPIERTGHHAIRFEVYLGSTDALLSLDVASLIKGLGQPSRPTLTLSSPGAEEGRGAWGPIMGSSSLTTSGELPLAGTQVLQASGNGSIGQDVPANGVAGESYTTGIWVRANTGTISGALVLWAMGSGGSEAGLTKFTVGTEWTAVQVTTSLSRQATALRPEVYFDSGGSLLYLDEASLSANLAVNPSMESATLAWNSGLTQNAAQRIAGTAALPAMDGNYLLSATYSGSIATDVKRRTAEGETYTATLWVRSGTPGATWSGDLALWAIGGNQEAAVQRGLQITDTGWTQLKIELGIGQPVHEALRLELYSGTPGVQLLIDGVVIR
jgi:hypothetical protein